MTLTTEQLRAIAEEELDACATLDAAKLMARELLANREAQPVAWRHDDGPFAGIAITRAKSVADSWIAKGWTATPLYTAPPAPAVPDGWKLVPIDATRAMIDAAQRVEEDGYDAMHKAMLAAAPEGGNG